MAHNDHGPLKDLQRTLTSVLRSYGCYSAPLKNKKKEKHQKIHFCPRSASKNMFFNEFHYSVNIFECVRQKASKRYYKFWKWLKQNQIPIAKNSFCWHEILRTYHFFFNSSIYNSSRTSQRRSETFPDLHGPLGTSRSWYKTNHKNRVVHDFSWSGTGPDVYPSKISALQDFLSCKDFYPA